VDDPLISFITHFSYLAAIIFCGSSRNRVGQLISP
jgi:hypothetical protein